MKEDSLCLGRLTLEVLNNINSNDDDDDDDDDNIFENNLTSNLQSWTVEMKN